MCGILGSIEFALSLPVGARLLKIKRKVVKNRMFKYLLVIFLMVLSQLLRALLLLGRRHTTHMHVAPREWEDAVTASTAILVGSLVVTSVRARVLMGDVLARRGLVVR